ncbi:DUF4259 domain-containing protein [Aeoliella sp.]|uniref:DUF4259 domain-containing protein n=1 Tax=Aeoliella sp. TaxID=2795800 RepID=UPI003CCB8C31
MGAWGMGSFENDAACDWACDLEDAEDLSVVSAAFEGVFEEDYLDSDEAAFAIAACEVLAALKGNPITKYEAYPTVNDWVKAHPQSVPADLVSKANLVLDRILAADSEMNELWEESDNYESWKSAVDDLRTRLNT